MDPETIKALREAEAERRQRNEEIIARAEARRMKPRVSRGGMSVERDDTAARRRSL
jgi:hypothetical protein